MAIKRNGAEVGTNGTAVTDGNKATTTADGDVFGQISISGAPTFEVSTAQAYYGTRSYYINGGSGTSGYPRWTGKSTAIAKGYIVFRYSTLPSAASTFLQVLTSGGTALASIQTNSSNQFLGRSDSGSTSFTAVSYTNLVNTWYRLDYNFVAGSTTSNGSIQFWLYLASATDMFGAGTPLATYSNTAANLGAAQTIGQTKLPGKQESGTTIGIYLDEMRESDTSTAPTLPSANVAPVANAGLDIDVEAGTNALHLSGTGTDSDGTVSGLAWTRVSGPTSPTISNSTSGIGTASASCTADVTVAVGTYVFRLTATDSSAATHTDDVTVYVRPAADADAYPVALDTDNWTTYGGAGSLLAAVTDADDNTGITTVDNPTAQVQDFTLPPLGLGPITIKLKGNRTASPAITRTVTLQKSDGSTTVATVNQLPGTTLGYIVFTINDAAALATIPTLADRRALRCRISSSS